VKDQTKPTERLSKEMETLYSKAAHWLYDRGQPGRARVYAERLAHILQDSAAIDMIAVEHSAHGNEVLALIAETRGDWVAAARYRERKLSLLKSLRQRATRAMPAEQLASSAYMSSCYVDYAIALRHVGHAAFARKAIGDAERAARKAGVEFEHHELKLEIELEAKAASRRPVQRPKANSLRDHAKARLARASRRGTGARPASARSR
jgi:hypothetical protein